MRPSRAARAHSGRPSVAGLNGLIFSAATASILFAIQYGWVPERSAAN
jgi:hypothetical protein